MTAGLLLVQHVWDHASRASWDALNHGMRQAIYLAVGTQMRFCGVDLEHILATMRPERWLDWERLYAFAITVDNRSFIKAFEEWFGREAFMANDVLMGDAHGFLHAGHCRRARGRLAVGFSIGGHLTRVASITNEHVVICTYRSHDDRAPATRQKLNHEQLAALYPAPKKAQKAPAIGKDKEE